MKHLGMGVYDIRLNTQSLGTMYDLTRWHHLLLIYKYIIIYTYRPQY